MMLPRPGVWQRKPVPVRRSFFQIYQWHILFQSVWVVAMMNRWTLIRHGALMAWFAYLTFAIAIWLTRELRARRFQRFDEALTERPAGLREFPVEVTLLVDQSVIGADRGVVYFENGHMGFAGSSFSFLLAARDFIDTKNGPIMQRDLARRRLLLQVPGQKAEVVMRPLIGYGKAFQEAKNRFFREAITVDGERQWPPSTKYVAPVIEEYPSANQDVKLEVEPLIEVGG